MSKSVVLGQLNKRHGSGILETPPFLFITIYIYGTCRGTFHLHVCDTF